MAASSRRAISGCYRGRKADFEVELRVDVDGESPTGRVSADYFRIEGPTLAYRASMQVAGARVRVEAERVTITGRAEFTDTGMRARRIRITIPRVAPSASRAPATLLHLSTAGVADGARYVCSFESQFFRKVELGEAVESGVTRFDSYDTGALPSVAVARTLSTIAAFREAGIEMYSKQPPTEIDASRIGANRTWNDAELHAAMEATFAAWRNREQWAIWLLHAIDHDDPDIAGLMFDRRGAPRQGCAIFYGAGDRTGAEVLRDRLFTCVHELGHSFNLLHSWQKSLARPPVPSRPAAASWMNYPERFPGGADAFWSTFSFAFDEPELVHLRHAFRSTIIMGGQALRSGGALTRDDGWDEEQADSGLRLRLYGPAAPAYGVPLTVGAELTATTREGRSVAPVFGPQSGTLDILVRAPDGTDSIFAPLLQHCRGTEARTLRAGDEPLRSRPFIHYGRGGLTFPTPGRYTVRGRFTAADGTIALAPPIVVHVPAALSAAEREIERLIAGDEDVAAVMTLVGSDAPQLQAATDKLREIIARHPTHAMADVGRVVLGTNLGRSFKRLLPDGTLQLREAKPRAAAGLVGSVLDIAAIQRAVAGADTPDADRRAVTDALATPASRRRGVDPSVAGFVVSRRAEVAAVRGAVRAGFGELTRRRGSLPLDPRRDSTVQSA